MTKEMPLYDQLIHTLKHQINTQMEPHDRMMSERELAIAYDMSRTTVRSAIKQLEIEGYIYKRHGKGTFVSDFQDRLANLSKMYSFTDQMIALGKTPSTKVLDFMVELASDVLAKRLSIDQNDEVYRIERLRLADDEPFMWEVSFLPVKLFPNLTRNMIEQQPLYLVLNETYQQRIRLANEEFFAGVVSGEQSRLLHIQENSPVFTIERTTFNHKNELIEYTQSIARGDRFRYHITHERKV